MPNRAVHTRVFASFHSDNPRNFDSQRDGDPPYKVVGLSTNKGFGEASGSWTLTLKPANPEAVDLMDVWDDPEGVWVRLAFIINGVVFDTMLGNIDSVRDGTQRAEQQGARTETLIVTGRDHGKVFETTEMYINVFEREGITPAVAAYEASHRNLQGRPHDFVAALVREWVGNNEISDSQWRLPRSLGGRSFYEILNMSTVSQRTRGDLQDPHIFNPDQMGRKLWDTLTEYSNGVLNEMWTDLAPDPAARQGTSPPTDPVTGRRLPVRQSSGLRPALYLRERPFPTRVPFIAGRGRYDALPTFDLFPDDIKDRDISKGGGANKYNFWLLDGSGFQSRSVGLWAQIQDSRGAETQGAPGGYPIYDLDSIRRHGLRRWTQSTKFLPLLDSDVGEIAYAVSGVWLNMCHDWYVVAPLERSGTIVTSRVMPWIRVGMRVREQTRTGRRIIYYVEGVAHKYSYPQGGATTLTLTRGEPEDRDFLDEVYERIEAANESVNDLEEERPGLDAEATPEEREAVREAPTGAAAGEAARGVGGAPAAPSDLEAGDGVIQLDEIRIEGSTTATPGVIQLDEVQIQIDVSEGDSQITDPDMNHDQQTPPPQGEFDALPPSHPVRFQPEAFGDDFSDERIDGWVEGGILTQEEAEQLRNVLNEDVDQTGVIQLDPVVID